MLEIGKYNKLPHYSVIGSPQDFYIWINEQGRGSASAWIKGNLPLYHKIRNCKDKNTTIALLKTTHKSLT